MAAYVKFADGDGWCVATDGGRKRVLTIHPEPGAGLDRPQVEAVARLVARAMEMPGGVEAAIAAVIAAY